MNDRIEIQGKTVEAAVSEALLQMGARRDEVEIKVLEEPKSGFMGFIGSRAARVLVRRKRSRRRGGERDHRVSDDDHQAHNLGKGGSRSRGGSRRASGKSAAAGDARTARENERGANNGSRRGSRGRGGQGRKKEAAGREQAQSQPQGRNQSQTDKRSQGAKSGGRGSRTDQRQAARKDSRQEKRPDKRQDDGTHAPQTATPIRPLRQEPASPAATSAASVHKETKAIEPKKETTVTNPIKPRRAFGGLGSRLKEKRKATEAVKVESSPAVESSSVSQTSAAEHVPAAPPPRPRPERQDRRTPSFASGSAGEEVVVAGIKGVKYAQPVGRITDEGLEQALTELTDAMLARAGFPCRCETLPGEYRQVKVTTDDASAGMLIGRHGQTVDAVEHLVERMASNAIDARARINLDINNYRMRREESLVERVHEIGDRVRETGRPVHLEPMSGRERRIVHLETEKLGGLRTFTMDGSGGKHVVISLVEEEATEASSDVQPDDA
jgi:predicted RNA-binding protein Jag